MKANEVSDGEREVATCVLMFSTESTLGYRPDFGDGEHSMHFDPKPNRGYGGNSVLSDLVHELGEGNRTK